MLPEIGMQHSLVFDQNCLVWKGNSSKTKILPKKNLKSNIFMGKLSEKVPSVLKIFTPNLSTISNQSRFKLIK